METPEERLVTALSHTLNALQRPLARHTSDAGLTYNQFMVLKRLLENGPVTINDLLEDLNATSGNLTVVIDNLVKAGLIEKNPVKEDRRKRLLRLTETGETRIQDYAPSYRSELRRLMRNIGLHDKQQLLKSLRALDRELNRTLH